MQSAYSIDSPRKRLVVLYERGCNTLFSKGARIPRFTEKPTFIAKTWWSNQQNICKPSLCDHNEIFQFEQFRFLLQQVNAQRIEKPKTINLGF